MPINNLIEYSDNYSKKSLWQYFKDEPDDTTITNSKSFKSKVRKNSAGGKTKDV